jgi:hypothetical protein
VKLLWDRGGLSKLRAADEERRQAKRNSLADKLTVEAKVLADLKIEKAAADGERRTLEADLGPVKYLAILINAPMTRRRCGISSSRWRSCSIQPRCCCCWHRRGAKIEPIDGAGRKPGIR